MTVLQRPSRGALLLLALACQPAAQRNPAAAVAASSTEPSAAVPAAAAAVPGAAAAVPHGASGAPLTRIEQDTFGDIGGLPVQRFTLHNRRGLWLRVIDYGAILTELHVPDRQGQLADIVLGFDRIEDYVQRNPYFGATIGRVANRIANARFQLEGETVKLAANDSPHHLHGGKVGWDKVHWQAEQLAVRDGAAVKLTYVSPHEDEGYPGTVSATTVYTLTDDDELLIDMSATTDRTTIVNMAHHSYFNLAGHASGTIEGHELQLFASRYTPAKGLVPTGAVEQVSGTPFDFTELQPIGKPLAAVGGSPPGFDHNWLVDGEPSQLRVVARLREPRSGRELTLSADQPGVQFYSGNFLNDVKGKGGAVYQRHAGLCLETQKVPNAINLPAWRDGVILKPGQRYEHHMRLKFTANAAGEAARP